MLLASPCAAANLALGDETHVLDPTGTQVVHGVHHVAVFDVFIGLDDDEFFRLRLEDVSDAAPEVTVRHRDGIDEEPAVRGDGHDSLILRLRLDGAVGSDGQPDIDALLQEGRDDHHDDEEHEHDVDERRDVDVGLDPGAATELHCHSENSVSSWVAWRLGSWATIPSYPATELPGNLLRRLLDEVVHELR